jgi:hypothetical protein
VRVQLGRDEGGWVRVASRGMPRRRELVAYARLPGVAVGCIYFVRLCAAIRPVD